MTLDVVLVSAGLPHDGNTLAERSLGGSETAAICVARALARRGHRVTAFAPCPGRTDPVVIDGVTWRPIEQAAAHCTALDHDVEVVSRLAEFCRIQSAARVRVLWCHDLAVKRSRGALGGVLWTLDAVYVLSAYQREQYVFAGGLPPEAFVVTRNGIDGDAFAPLRGLSREPGKLVYGSRPERGLETALRVMDRLRAQGSPAVLHCAWYDNTPPEVAPLYEQLWAAAKARPNVRLLGPLRQDDWRRELATAQALLYPGCAGDFREISCIAAMEAMAAGTPVVACAKGALPETLGARFDAASRWAWGLVGDESTPSDSPAFVAAFADRVAMLLGDPERWRQEHEAGLFRARQLDWSGVAAQWEGDWLWRLTTRSRPRPLLAARWRKSGDAEIAAALAQGAA